MDATSSMYPPAELGSVQTYAPSPTPSPLPYHFPTATHNEACLALNQKGTSYAMMAAMISDPVFTAPAVLGSVRLMLGNKHTIHAAIVSIKGQIITSANATKHFTFLDITKTIWSKSNDITHPSTHPTTSSNVHKDISGKKLTGDHFWPFTIALPKEVLLPSRTKREPELFRLPESFHERHVRASVQYSLHLRLVRGRFRPDNKLKIAPTYPPAESSDSFPFPRQSFCGTPSLLSGPNGDPEAWYSHRGVLVAGRLKKQHIIDVKYTLSLAKPLWYARGSVISCSLAIEANDEGVLDALSSPAAPLLRLRRCVKCHDGTSLRLQSPTRRDAIDYSHSAIWWPSPESTRLPNLRRLSGELQLPPDMKPTTAIAHFSIEYSVILFPSDTPTFVFSSEDPLAIVNVEIA